VSRRLKQAELAAQTVSLKLKTAEFRLLTRHRRLADPTQLAETLYQAAKPLVEREADGRPFRLIGIGAETLVEGVLADPPDLLDRRQGRQAGLERAIDQVEAELGPGLLMRGRGFKPPER
jgi:DNA polymerase-4